MTRHVSAAMDNQPLVFMGTSSGEFKIEPPERVKLYLESPRWTRDCGARVIAGSKGESGLVFATNSGQSGILASFCLFRDDWRNQAKPPKEVKQ
jgi:hypothetical protein